MHTIKSIYKFFLSATATYTPLPVQWFFIACISHHTFCFHQSKPLNCGGVLIWHIPQCIAILKYAFWMIANSLHLGKWSTSQNRHRHRYLTQFYTPTHRAKLAKYPLWTTSAKRWLYQMIKRYFLFSSSWKRHTRKLMCPLQGRVGEILPKLSGPPTDSHPHICLCFKWPYLRTLLYAKTPNNTVAAATMPVVVAGFSLA